MTTTTTPQGNATRFQVFRVVKDLMMFFHRCPTAVEVHTDLPEISTHHICNLMHELTGADGLPYPIHLYKTSGERVYQRLTAVDVKIKSNINIDLSF